MRVTLVVAASAILSVMASCGEGDGVVTAEEQQALEWMQPTGIHSTAPRPHSPGCLSCPRLVDPSIAANPGDLVIKNEAPVRPQTNALISGNDPNAPHPPGCLTCPGGPNDPNIAVRAGNTATR